MTVAPPRTPWWRSAAFIVFAVAVVYSFAVTWPVVVHPGTTIYGYPGDATGTVAIYWYWFDALRNGGAIFDNQLWGAPYGAGWHAAPFAVTSLLKAPLAALFGGTFVYNLEILSSFPLTAWVTYLVARRLGATRVGGAFAGLAFAFIPYHIEKAQGHSSQAHMEVFPATLLFLIRWRQGGSRWNLVAAGAMAGLTLWNDIYFAYIDAFLVATFFIASYLDERIRRSGGLTFRAHLVGGAIVGLATAVLVPPAILLAFRPGGGSGAAAAVGVQQGLVQVQIYSSRPWEFLAPFHANPLLPKRVLDWEIAHLHGSNFTEQSLFLGYVVMALALVAVLAYRRRFEPVLLLALGFVGFVISLPPAIHFKTFNIPLPSQALDALFPIFRVYSRFGVLVILGAMLLAGLGLTAIQARLHGRHAWLLAIPFVLTAVEFNNLPPTHTTQIDPAPAAYRWLADQPPGILVEYPLDAGTPQELEVQTRQYTLHQHSHGHPLFNGATVASPAFNLYPELEPYYGTVVPGMLKQIGIRYVFVHTKDYQHDGYAVPTAVDGLTYVQTLDGVAIFTVG